MAVAVTKAGPYYSSGPISFGSLRNTFKEANSGQIKASELRRNTSLTEKNPIVPDSTENVAISTLYNLKLSQFKNSVKYYYITQTDTDINFDISGQSWNDNLNKNIKKWMYINGTCGSNTTSSPASSLTTTSCNLTIDVSGSILGASGAGGTLSSISGKNGGNALYITSANGKNIVVYLRDSAKIYGGGGGGEKGLTGSNGSSGSCVNYTYYEKKKCKSCPSCDGDDKKLYCYNRQGRCSWFYQYREIKCQKTNYNSVNGGAGGEGGDGGLGRGYNNLTGSLSGDLGYGGGSGGCSGYDDNGSPIPTDGQTGETGGIGGDWGENGAETNNTSSGGIAGKSISGSNYTVEGSINSDTIKGYYNPQ